MARTQLNVGEEGGGRRARGDVPCRPREGDRITLLHFDHGEESGSFSKWRRHNMNHV